MASVLMFNITDPQKVNELNVLSLRLNFSLQAVPCDRQHCLIRNLLDGKDSASAATPVFKDEMLVMDGMTHADLNFLLNELIRTGNSIPLKAVVTPTNREWPAAMLYTQLVQENRRMNQKAGKNK